MTYKLKKQKKPKKKETFEVENKKDYKISEPFKNSDFEIKEIKDIVIPHPYGITPKHLSSDRMYLDKEAIEEAEDKGAECFICKGRVKAGVQTEILPYSEHKEQKTLFLQMKTDEKDLNKVEGLHEYLKKIKPELEKQKIEGIAFIPKEK